MKTKLTLALLLLLCVFPVAVRASEADITETGWQVTAICDDGGTLRNLIPGTEITASFSEEGKIWGTAGCNRYSGDCALSAPEGKMTIKSVASTRMYCADPDGVMEQEARYLSALQNVRGFRTGFYGRLDLLKADGSVAVSMLDDDARYSAELFSDGINKLVLYIYDDSRCLTAGARLNDEEERHMRLAEEPTEERLFYKAADNTRIILTLTESPEDVTAVVKTENGRTLKLERLAGYPRRYGRTMREIMHDGLRKVIVQSVYGTEDFILLTRNGKTYWMKRDREFDGWKYQEVTDPETTLLSRDTDAVLTLGGVPYELRWLEAKRDCDFIIPEETAEQPLIGEWRAERLNGKPLLAGTTITMNFAENGRVYGKATVNNYFSSWLTAGNLIIISGGGSTMMAGPPERMEQERLFLVTLNKVRKYEIKGEELVMTAADGARIEAVKVK